MFKGFFIYSNSERRAAIILIVLILLAILVYVSIPEGDNDSSDDIALSQFEKEVKAFEASRQHVVRTAKYRFNYPSHTPFVTSVFDFDPNSADSITFLRLGLKPFQAKSILKYRSKGGKFRKPDDFAKVPFLDQNLFLKLKPHILINEKYALKRDTLPAKKPPFVKQEKYAEGVTVDVATADTSELKKIPGIASGTAKSIVAYRTRLGGFYDVTQLKEIKNISDEQFQKISKFIRINELKINRLSINKSGFERLRSHPYLNFYQVKAILELRKKKGRIGSFQELSLYEEFTPSDFERLKYYFDFTQ